MTLVAKHNSEPWPAERLREARAILADVAHHPDTRVVLAARVVIAHSRDEVECRDARALRCLFDPNSRRSARLDACPQGGVA